MRALTQLAQAPNTSTQERLETHSILASHHQRLGKQGRSQAQHHIEQALKLWSQIESDPSLNEVARKSACHAAARATFTRAELMRQEFEEIEIKFNDELKATLTQKTHLNRDAQERYRALLGLGQRCAISSWQIAAKVRIGDVLASFAVELDEVKIPYKVDEEDLARFKKTIFESSDPLLIAAQERYEEARAISAQGPVAELWSKLAQTKLEEVKRYQCEHEHKGCTND